MEDTIPIDERREGKGHCSLLSQESPGTLGGLKEDQAIPWVIATINRGQGFSLAKPDKRLSAWYHQTFCRCQKDRTKTLGGREALIHRKELENRVTKSHEGLEQLWDYRQF